MEHYLSLHGITNDLMKLRVGDLYLDTEHWQWWQWYKNAYRGYISWSHFVKTTYACFEQDTHYLGQLTKIRQTSTVTFDSL
jgi:hypothetical protein